MKKESLGLFGGLLMLLCSNSNATIWHVTQGGNDSNDGSSWETPLATLQQAIDKAESGDEIHLGPGVFKATHIIEVDSESIYSASFVLKEGVSIFGGYSGTVPEIRSRTGNLWDFSYETVLTVPEELPGSVIINPNTFTQETIIDGVTITGGIAVGGGDAGNGGGINVKGTVILENCIVKDNIARNGGGAYISGGAQIKHTLITGNALLDEGWSGNGGGIYSNGNCSLSNSVITANGSGARKGGGIYGSGAISVDHCTITANTSTRDGSGIYFMADNSSIANSVIWGNTGSVTQAFLNGTADHCAVEGVKLGATCIPLQNANCGEHGISSNDNWVGGYYPCFISPENGDWKLAAGSYLINRATTSNFTSEFDASGITRTLCGHPDIGAFEAKYRGNITMDFELELPCIYGNSSTIEPIYGTLTPEDIIVSFSDASELATWKNNNNGTWTAQWNAADIVYPALRATPDNSANWTQFVLVRELTVARRPLYITANDQEYTYLEDMPSLTWEITAGTLAEGDKITGALQCIPTAKLETPWSITRGSLEINDGAFGSNYQLTFYNGEMICHKADTDIAFQSSSTQYNGSPTSPQINTEPEGLKYTCTYTDEDGQTSDTPPVNAGKYQVEVTIDDDNYAGTYTAEFTIEKAELTASGSNATRPYLTENPSFSVNVTGFLGHDNLADITIPTASTLATTTSNAGEYAITVAGGSAANYTFRYVPGTLTVTAADIVAAVDDSAITYGTPIADAPIEGTATHNITGTTVPGTFSWDDTKAPLTAGTHQIGWSFTPDDATNYKSAHGTASIDVAQYTLHICADDQDVQYGEKDVALTYSVLETLPVATDATGTLQRENGTAAGRYAITRGTLSYGKNYNVVFEDAIYTITPRRIEITLDNASKEFGDLDGELTYEISSGSLAGKSYFIGEPAREPGEKIGNYAIRQGTLTVSDEANYNISIVEGTFSITKSTKPGIVDSITIAPITYGDSLQDITIEGVVLTPNGLEEMPGTFQWVTPEMTPDAGLQSLEWIFTPENATEIEPFTGFTEVEVAKATLLVTLNGGSPTRYYKTPNPQYTYTYNGFLFDDTETCIKQPPELDTEAEYNSQPGTYTVGIKGGLADNYTFATQEPRILTVLGRKVVASDASELDATPICYGDKLEDSEVSGYIVDEITGDIITGTFIWKSGDAKPVPGSSTQQCLFIPASPCYTGSTITIQLETGKGEIAITSLPASKRYQEQDPVIKWTCTDGKDALLASDSIEITIGREEGEDAGTYKTILVSANENPFFDYVFTPGTFTIFPKALTVTANDTFKYYMNNDPELTCTIVGEMPAGIYIDGALQREEGEEVGTYKITRGTLDTNSPNYYIDIVPGTFTIYKRPLEIKLVQNTKVYDKKPEGNLAYTVINSLAGSTATLTGNVTRKGGENVGQYLVDKSGLVPSDPAHFCVSPNNVFFTITPRSVTIQLDDKEMTYNDPFPEFTHHVVEGEIMPGDAVIGTAIAIGAIGENTIQGNTLSLGANYKLTVVPGVLTVYTDVPYLVFEGFDKDICAYDYAEKTSYTAKAYRVHFDTEVPGTFLLKPTHSPLNAGTETANLTFTYNRRMASNLSTTYSSTVTEPITFYVPKLRMSVNTGDYTIAYGDDMPEMQYTLLDCASSSVTKPLSLLTGDFISFDIEKNKLGTYPIIYNAEKMTNSNIELSIQTGMLTIEPRKITVQAESGYALKNTFNLQNLNFDYEVASVNNATTIKSMATEKEEAPVLDLTHNIPASPEVGVYKLSFVEFNENNYSEYSDLYDFSYEEGLFFLYLTYLPQNKALTRKNNREQYANNLTLSKDGKHAITFVNQATDNIGANCFASLEDAYANTKAGGIICLEPGTYTPIDNMFTLTKPIQIIGICDDNGNLPTIQGTVRFYANSNYSSLEYVAIDTSNAHAVNINTKNVNILVSNCNLTSSSIGVYQRDSENTIEDCTINAPLANN